MSGNISRVRSTGARLGTAVAVMGLTLSAWASTANSQSPGIVTFVNNCEHDLVLFTPGSQVGGLIGTLPKGGSNNIPLAKFNQGAPNLILAYQTNMSNDDCPKCDQWTGLGWPPGTTQRAGWMWALKDGHSRLFARYCNPSLSGSGDIGVCALQGTCCGPKMTRDGTFGSHFELTPGGWGSNDYVNLSTNYGSGPNRPPALCGQGVPKDDCVTKAANIFFNLPVDWRTNLNLPCSFSTRHIPVTGGVCREADCTDAYQHPTDDKQVACPTNSNRGYLVTYCPK